MIKLINTYYREKKLTEAPVGDLLKGFASGLGTGLLSSMFGINLRFDKGMSGLVEDLQLERIEAESAEGFVSESGVIFHSKKINSLYLIVNCAGFDGLSIFVYDGAVIPSEQLPLLGVGAPPETGEMIRLDKLSNGDIVAISRGEEPNEETHEEQPTEEEVEEAQETVTEDEAAEVAPKENVKLLTTFNNKYIQNICNFSVQNQMKLLENFSRFNAGDIAKYNDAVKSGDYGGEVVNRTYQLLLEGAIQTRTKGDLDVLCQIFRINDEVRSQIEIEITLRLRELAGRGRTSYPTDKTLYIFFASILTQIVSLFGASASQTSKETIRALTDVVYDYHGEDVKWIYRRRK